MPDVGVNLSVHIFQFIQLLDRLTVLVRHMQSPRHAKRLRIKESQCRAPIAHDQLRLIVREPPTLSCVVERAQQRKAEAVIHESLVRLPRQLNQIATAVGQPFAEILGRQVVLLQNLSRLQVDKSDRRLPVLARTLIQMSIYENQPLRESPRIMGINVDHLVCIDAHRSRRRGHQRSHAEKYQEQEETIQTSHDYVLKTLTRIQQNGHRSLIHQFHLHHFLKAPSLAAQPHPLNALHENLIQPPRLLRRRRAVE
jgi:hypothetical protein